MYSKLSPISSHLSARKGFTLIELLIYSALTAVIVGIFAGILISVANIQGHQTSDSQLTNEVGFLISDIQRIVHSGVDVSIPNSHTLVVTVSTSPSITDTITQSGATVQLTETDQSGSANSTLSTPTITIDDLTFTDRSSGLSKSVGISLTATIFPNNSINKQTKTIQSTAALYLQEQ